MRKFADRAVILLALSSLISCQSGPCRTVKNPELERQQATNQLPTATSIGPNSQTSATTPPTAVNVPGNGSKPSLAPKPTVFVYKADGSLQCGQGQGMKPEDMEKQLKGIKVHSRENRSDGLMHIQVCGSPTGQINVFEIDASSLKNAEKRGFKKFESR